MYQDSDRCWQICLQKDSAYDGVFVVGVMTTKIYCRPSCSARPLRKNVRFFADNASAADAGLRPCKRCTPDTLTGDQILCQKVCRYIESCTRPPTLTQIADAVGYSPFHLQRTFKHVIGISPFAYAQTLKWIRFAQTQTTHETVQSAIRAAGFGSISSYYHAHAQLKQVRMYSQEQTLQLGRCLHHGYVVIGVFSDNRIVYCGIYVDDAHANKAMQCMFPHGIPTIADLQSAALADILSAHHDATTSAIAKDIRATAFQHQVWQAIREIPSGETRKYHEVAQAIGHPQATRAVANACASNPLAVITPCHRVVSAGSTIGGYRWGTTIKAQLLIAEREGVYNGATVDSKEQ